MTTTDVDTQLDSQCIATIRTPCIDAIQAANSG
jgi:transketolase